jgi:hypothetical protein
VDEAVEGSYRYSNKKSTHLLCIAFRPVRVALIRRLAVEVEAATGTVQEYALVHPFRLAGEQGKTRGPNIVYSSRI